VTFCIYDDRVIVEKVVKVPIVYRGRPLHGRWKRLPSAVKEIDENTSSTGIVHKMPRNALSDSLLEGAPLRIGRKRQQASQVSWQVCSSPKDFEIG
jgi:hypothetical protein